MRLIAIVLPVCRREGIEYLNAVTQQIVARPMASLGVTGAQFRAPLSPLQCHRAILHQGDLRRRGGPQLDPIMLRDVSLSDS